MGPRVCPGVGPDPVWGSAPYHVRGRLPYSPRLAEAFVDALSLDGRGRLLDVGTGPGIIALTLAGHFEEVVGVDADAEMVAEASRQAERQGIQNARWLSLRAEDLPADLGRFGAVTFAQSFHWTRREEVAKLVVAMLEPAVGRLILVNAYTREGVASAQPLSYPAPPHERIAALVERYLGSVRRAGQSMLPDGTPWDEEDVLARAGFRGPEVVSVPDDRVIERTMDDVVASVYSVSRSAPHLFGEKIDDFERELRALLSDSSPTGLFFAQTGENQLRIWSHPSARGSFRS